MESREASNRLRQGKSNQNRDIGRYALQEALKMDIQLMTEIFQSGYDAGYRAAMQGVPPLNPGFGVSLPPQFAGPTNPIGPMYPAGAPTKPKRKASAYNKRVGAALRRLKKQHTLKNGKWRKGWNQKRLMKAAHAAAKKK